MLLPLDYEMQKLLKEQDDKTLQEYFRAIQTEIERRKNDTRKNYERKLTVLFQHMEEEGLTAYVSLPSGFRKLSIKDIEICEDD